VTTSVAAGEWENSAAPVPKTPISHHGLQYYYQNTVGTSSQPTWYDYHLYGGPNNDQRYLIGQVLQAVGGNPDLLRFGEFGYDVEGSSETSAQLAAQATYAQSARYYANQAGLRAPSWWSLMDVAPSSGGQFPTGQSDGLYTVSGTLKSPGPGAVYRRWPANTVPSWP
jgi:hypothetical protein